MFQWLATCFGSIHRKQHSFFPSNWSNLFVYQYCKLLLLLFFQKLYHIYFQICIICLFSRPRLCIGSYSGLLQLWDYEKKYVQCNSYGCCCCCCFFAKNPSRVPTRTELHSSFMAKEEFREVFILSQSHLSPYMCEDALRFYMQMLRC